MTPTGGPGGKLYSFNAFCAGTSNVITPVSAPLLVTPNTLRVCTLGWVGLYPVTPGSPCIQN